jgi:hypothetical protein
MTGSPSRGTKRCRVCQEDRPGDEFYPGRSECKQCKKAYAQRRHFERTYGISLEERDALLRGQGGRCAICRGIPENHVLHVDHCHVTGKVRAMLCYTCNRLLGDVGDSTDLLLDAIEYLRRHR